MNQVFRAIIIDDEPAARRLIRTMLEEHHDTVHVIAEAGNGKEALRKIEEMKPDLIFLDIQMPDLTGFEVVERLKEKPNIIFTTAFEQYAIRAFETFSIDYLLKPIKEDRLTKSIEKLKQFGRVSQAITLQGLQEIIRQFQTPQKATALPIKTGDRITLLRYDDMVYLEAQDKYVFVFTRDSQKHITDQSLTSLIEKLPPQFYRIQKSYIINRDRIREMHRHLNSRFLFIMDDKAGTRLTSGRTYHDPIRADFGL
jgi:two-component system, LytTR family, response regulator